MLARATALWVAGLLTLVPYGAYYLLFHAGKDQYAALITLVLFWIFGYWGVVGPLLAAIKVRTVFRAIERAKSKESLIQALRSAEARDVAIDLIVSENRIPRFLASRVVQLLAGRLSSGEVARAQRPPTDTP
jgi:hypothetical protein